MSNITVAVRVRPLIAWEIKEKLPEVWKVDGITMYPIDPVTQKPGPERYIVDQIYDNNFETHEIYMDIVKPILDAVVSGYNGTIFAYGQTSSGKTHTMMGDDQSIGIIQLTIHDIFDLIENVRDRKFLLRCQYIELYNDKVLDLLNNNKECKIRESENGEPKTDAKEVVVDSASMLFELMDEGNKVRTVGETKANQKSSRSHAVFRIVMESTKFVNEEIVAQVGQLNLVDLAGSERASVTGATGSRLKEGAQINKSLSALGLVIKQLGESRDHVNFRDSKLTRLLEPSLGGNALTAIICAVTPAALEETHSTLAFACRAKDIKNKPILNVVESSESLLNKYAMEIKKLTDDLKKASVSSQDKDEMNRVLAEKVEFLEQRLIYRSRLLEKKKKCTRRRKTWAGVTLPVIDEGETWEPCVRVEPPHEPPQNPTQGPSHEPPQNPTQGPPQQTEEQDPPAENADEPRTSDGLKEQGEGDRHDDTLQDDNPTDESDTTAENPEKIIQWLVDDKVSTPKCVLKERADYYEEEFKTLQEHATTEYSFITQRMDRMLVELTEAHLFAQNEQEKRENEGADWKKQVTNLEEKLATQAANMSQLQKICDMQEVTYMEDLCEQATTLRSLKDQLMALHDEDCEAVRNLNAVIDNYDLKINELKNIVVSLDGDPEDAKDFEPAIRVLKSICEKSTEVELSLDQLPEDSMSFFRIFQTLCNVVSELLIITMMKEQVRATPSKKLLKKTEERLFKFKAMMASKDLEIEELSDKIMEYLSQLDDAEKKVKEIKEAGLYFQNQSDDKDKEIANYFVKMETMKEKCLNITKMTDLKIKVLKDEITEWKTKYEAAEKELGIRIDEEMTSNAKLWEKDDQLHDLKSKLKLLQTKCEDFLRRINLVGSDEPLSIEEISEGLDEQERHTQQLLAIVGDLRQKMEEMRMLHLPSLYVDQVEANRVRARDEEIKSLSEALQYQSVKLEEYRKILTPTDRTEPLPIDLHELKRSAEILQKRNLFLMSDSATKDEVIKQQTSQIEQLKSDSFELVNNAQNAGFNLTDDYLSEQEKTKAELQVALEQQTLAWQKIGQLEMELEQKNVLIKQVKEHMSNRSEKDDDLLDIFELKESESFKEKEEKYELMTNELNLQNNKVDELTKDLEHMDTLMANVVRDRDAANRNIQELRLKFKCMETELEDKTTEVVGLRSALKNQSSLTTTIQELSKELAGKNKLIEELKDVSEEKNYYLCKTKDQEKTIITLEGELDKRETVSADLSEKITKVNKDMVVKNETLLSVQAMLQHKENEVDAANEALLSVQAVLQHKEEEVDTATVINMELNEQVTQLKTQMANKNDAMDKLKAEIVYRNEEISDMNVELDKKIEAVKYLQQLVKEKDEIIQEDEKQLDEMQEMMNEEFNADPGLIQTLEDELRGAKESLVCQDELTDRVNTLTLELAETNAMIQNMEDVSTNLNQLKNVNLELVEKNKMFTEVLKKKEERIQSLEEELDVVKQSVVNQKELSDKLTTLSLELTEKNAMIQNMEAGSTNLKQLKKVNLELVEKNRFVEKLVLDKDLIIKTHKNDLNNLKETFTEDLKTKEERIQSLEEELDVVKQSVVNQKELSDKLTTLSLELTEKNAMIQNMEAGSTNLKQLKKVNLELVEKNRFVEKLVLDKDLIIKTHKNDLNNLKETFTEDLKTKEERIQSLEEELDVVKQSVVNQNELSDKLTTLSLELTEKNAMIQNMEAGSTNLKQLKNVNLELVEKNRFVEKLVLDKDLIIKTHKNDLNNLKETFTEDLKTKEERIQSLEEELDVVKQSVVNQNELSDKLTTLSLELTEKNAMIQNMEAGSTNLKQLKKVNLELVEKNRFVEKLVLDKDLILKTHKNDVNNLKETFTEDLKKKEERIQSLEEELDGLKQSLVNNEESSDKLKTLTLELAETNAIIQNMEDVSNNLQQLKKINLELVEKNEVLENLVLDKDLTIQTQQNDLHSSKEASTENLKKKEERIQSLEEELDGVKQSLVNQDELSKLNAQLAEKDAKIESLITTTSPSRDERIKLLETELDQKEALLKTSRDESLLKLSAKEEQIIIIKNVSDEKDVTLKSQQDTISTVTSILQVKEREIKAYEYKTIDLELKLADKAFVETTLNEQSEKIKALQEELEKQAVTSTEDFQTGVAKLERELVIRDEEINTFRELVGQKNVTLGHHQALIDQLHETNDKSKELIKEKDKEIQELRIVKQNYSKLQPKINVLLNQYNTLKGASKNREGENELLQTELSKLGTAHKKLDEKAQTWVKQCTLLSQENNELKTKIASVHTEQNRLDSNTQSQKQIAFLRDELARQKEKFGNIAVELEDLRRRYMTICDDLKATRGALENASDHVRRLKYERIQVDTENTRLDENLKAANIEITKRLKERDCLKRELRNTQFDASRDLQDAQTETEAGVPLSQKTSELSIESGAATKDVAISTDVAGEDESIKSMADELAHIQNEFKSLNHKYQMVKKLCRIRKEKIDTLEKEKM